MGTWWPFQSGNTFFQFGEFVLNSFFASPSPLLSSLFFFSNSHYLDLLGYSSKVLTFSPLLIHLFVCLFYFFESFRQPSNYPTVIFIFSTICLISNHSFLFSECYFSLSSILFLFPSCNIFYLFKHLMSFLPSSPSLL